MAEAGSADLQLGFAAAASLLDSYKTARTSLVYRKIHVFTCDADPTQGSEDTKCACVLHSCTWCSSSQRMHAPAGQREILLLCWSRGQDKPYVQKDPRVHLRRTPLHGAAQVRQCRGMLCAVGHMNCPTTAAVQHLAVDATT